MSNKKRKNSDGYRALVYIRYILPIIFCIAIWCITFVPCLAYATGSSTPNDPVSLRELFGNSWDNVRVYLFGGGEQSPALHSFSVKMLVTLIVTFVLFAIGFISTVIVAFSVFSFFAKRNRRSRAWLTFITFVPNRIVVCILQGLTLPLLLLPRLVVPMYKTMGEAVTLTTTGVEPLVWGIVFFVISVALSIVSSFVEKEKGFDAFDRPKELPEEVDTDSSEEDYTPSYTRGRAYIKDEADQKTKGEQEELIKKLLGNDKEENNK